MEELVFGLVLLAVGLWVFFDPKGALDMKVKMAKMWGIKMIPSKKTYQMYKYFGAILAAIGVFIIL